jgi:arginase
MDNQYILTPYFMGERAAGLDDLGGPGWVVNRRAEEPATAAELTPQRRQEQIVILLKPLRDAVAGAARAGRRPVSIAGDCVATMGVLAGLQEAGVHPTLIWFDAHGDLIPGKPRPAAFSAACRWR